MKPSKPINQHIIQNELSATDWALSDIAHELYWWVDLFNLAFFSTQPVPTPVLSFQKTTIRNLGHHTTERNAFGIRETINLNASHLNRPLWEILATLLHEMCHSWQATYGTPSRSWFHNKEFQQKMFRLGILCNPEGRHTSLTNPFLATLKRHGVKFNPGTDKTILIPVSTNPRGESKLKKWRCPCGQILRVGRKNLFATCDLCNQKFRQSP
jgi:hypothetical protein